MIKILNNSNKKEIKKILNQSKKFIQYSRKQQTASFSAKKISFSKKLLLIGTSITLAVSSGYLIYSKFIQHDRNEDEHLLEKEGSKQSIYIDDLKANLSNKPPLYIESPKIENLISLPRYQSVLVSIKLANLYPTRQNYQKLIEELEKLSDYGNSLEQNEINKLEDLIKLKILKHKYSKTKRNPFLNDGLANYICQKLNDEFLIELAFKAPHVDNRFFRPEPPSTIQKLNKIMFKSKSNKTFSIYDDPDYSLLFEFYNNFSLKIESASKDNQKLKKSDLKLYIIDKDLLNSLSKFHTEMNSLIVSEYFIKDRPKQNIWSSSDTDYLLDDLDDENFDSLIEDLKSSEKQNNEKSQSLKQKKKVEFIKRNETLMLSLIEKMVKIDLNEFISLGGMELLLLIYEKRKLDEMYLNTIGSCLSLISLKSEYKKLFVQSGWVKRLNQMCNQVTEKINNDNIDLVNELLGQKILFNLNQKEDDGILYSSMIYPLYPLYLPSIDQTNHLLEYDKKKSTDNHQHVIDIIFIHGLRGSLFKSWRQDDTVSKKVEVNSPNDIIPKLSYDFDESLLNKITNIIEKHFNIYSFCWPKDWLPSDLINEIQDYQEKDNIDKFRIMGINYESLFSLWGHEITDDKKLKSSIRHRAIDLIDQLKQAHVGDRPCVWICHSMGGLIIKQLLVHLAEIGDKKFQLLKNTKAIIFLSTPHLGSTVAKTATQFSFATNPSTELVELSTNSKYLVELNKKFLDLINVKENSGNLKILSLCENLPTYFGFNLYAKTVTEASANIGIGEFYLIDNKDHLNICKPANRNCVIYLKIKDLLNDIIKTENLNCVKCRNDFDWKENRTYIDHLYERFKLNFFY